jgi:ankyrin repeat protein
LIKAGASPAQQSSRVTVTSGGKTFTLPDSIPLFNCIQKGQTAMAKTLLEKGANPEPVDLRDNRNLVYWAVYYNQPEILTALIDHGANPSLKDFFGETPLALAQKSHQDLVPILQDAIKRTETRKE